MSKIKYHIATICRPSMNEQIGKDKTSGKRQVSRRFEEIDVLRGLAALVVVFSHYIPYWNRYNSDITVWVPGSLGHDAVLLFFPISGFVIFMTLERCKTVLDFAVLRFSRLYPAYWVTLIFSTLVVVLIFNQTLWTGGFIVNLTMFQEFVRFKNFDNVYWSLTVELAFYLNIAWIFVLGLHKHRSRLVITWLLISCIYGVTLFNPDVELKPLYSIFLALEFSPYFSIGIVFYEVVKKGWSQLRAVLLVLSIATVYLLHGDIEAIKAAIIVAIMGAALSGLLAFSVSRVTLWLGAISYSLYLIHRNVGYAVLSWMYDIGLGPVVSITLVTLFALAAASFITYFVERPVQKRIRKWYFAFRQNRLKKQ